MRTLLLPLAMLLALVTTPSLANEQAEAAYERASATLRTGDFATALAGYADAAAADPENSRYQRRVDLLERVQRLRTLLAESEADAETWEKAARFLRSFYLSNGIHGEAVALDERRLERFRSPAARVDLAESCLRAGLDQRSVVLLAALEPEHVTTRSELLRGTGLARTGELAAARAIAQRVAASEEGAPAELLERACLNALVGDLDKAAAQLRVALSSSPDAEHASLLAKAKTRADLAALRTPAHAAVFATKPKAEEASGCPGCESGACGH